MLANLANIVNQQRRARCSKRIEPMFHTGPSNRPLVYIANEKTPQSRIVRTRNTVVFNPEFLFQIDHPDLPRRGDSLWAILF